MKHSTSWQPVASWYNSAVGEKGHYFHQHVVIPNTLRLLDLKPTSRLLDLACGQGVIARATPKIDAYLGIDLSSSLITQAQHFHYKFSTEFKVHDITRPLPISQSFTHATIILALQNIAHPESVFSNLHPHLMRFASLVIVLNHPCFRIPRQTSWETDTNSKLQYRRVNRYLSPLKIPITAHPGQTKSPITWSFHQPLSAYSVQLHQTGFAIEVIEEWTSDKTSSGPNAKMENISRQEIPLFLAIKAFKK
jgi:SAM-dependent methyltransferase